MRLCVLCACVCVPVSMCVWQLTAPWSRKALSDIVLISCLLLLAWPSAEQTGLDGIWPRTLVLTVCVYYNVHTFTHSSPHRGLFYFLDISQAAKR